MNNLEALKRIEGMSDMRYYFNRKHNILIEFDVDKKEETLYVLHAENGGKSIMSTDEALRVYEEKLAHRGYLTVSMHYFNEKVKQHHTNRK